MKPTLTSLDINAAKKAGKTEITLPENALVTFQALDDAKACGITIRRDPSPIRDTTCKTCAGKAPVGPDAGEQDALIVRLRQKIADRMGNQADAASVDKAIRAVLKATDASNSPCGEQSPPATIRQQESADKSPQSVSGVKLSDAHARNSPDGPAPSLPAFTRHAGGVTHVRKNALPEAGPKGEPPFPEAVDIIEARPPTDASPGIAYMSWENSSFSWTCAHAEVLVVLAGEIVVVHEGTEFTASAGDALHITAGSSVTLAAGGRALCLLNSWPVSGR
ncbi:MAG: hypothetical protein LBS65_11590 [Desulfovibrio sp.]|jgi:uncharacterized cupin superfamily protein|nr:hypothetical protein [Desulfovibrio sp.]